MKKIFALSIIGAFLLAACLPHDTQVPQSPLLAALERKSGLIAYVGADGNMYISDQAGGNLTQLTKDAVIPETQGEPLLYYQYPAWSHDGGQVAFVGLSAEGEQVETKVMVANVDNDSVNEVYKSQSEHPIYLNWSPDSANVTFLSTNVSAQNTILQSVPVQGGERTILDTGSPYYWSWAPDGKVMIVHAGGAAASTPEHVAFLNMDSPAVLESAVDVPLVPVATASGATQAFQAPAWSPDGSRIALAQISDKGNEIIVTDPAGENQKSVGTFTQKTAFAWSGDSKHLAYIDGQQPLEAGTVGSLHVVDLESSEEIVEEGDIIAFFWSPSGEELAYFVLRQVQADGSSSGDSSGSGQTTAQYVLQLHVLDVTNGESRELFSYRPTQQFLSILPYFDQYHQSATIWSPDNNNLVLSFVNSSGSPGIAIVAASGKLEPRILAEGYLAFWSWK